MPTQSPRLGQKPLKSGGVLKRKQLKPKYSSSKYRYLYNKNAWKRASKAFLQENPLCVCDECKERVVPLPATVTDHVIPHKGDVLLFWDRDNWQAMAKKHHDRKTAIEDGGFGKEINESGKRNTR